MPAPLSRDSVLDSLGAAFLRCEEVRQGTSDVTECKVTECVLCLSPLHDCPKMPDGEQLWGVGVGN